MDSTKLELISHSFPDDPSWIIMREDIPIGTKYEMLGYEQGITIFNALTGKFRNVDCYLVRREYDDNEGFLPCCCLKVIES